MELRSKNITTPSAELDVKTRARHIRFLSSLISDLSDLLCKSVNNQHTTKSIEAVDTVIEEFPTVLLKIDIPKDLSDDSESEESESEESECDSKEEPPNGLWESVDVAAVNKKIEELEKNFDKKLEELMTMFKTLQKK